MRPEKAPASPEPLGDFPTARELYIASLPSGTVIGSFAFGDSPVTPPPFTEEGHARSLEILKRVISQEDGIPVEDVEIDLRFL